jgi:LPXTG-site transpeptidase (sortase) family protein
VNTIAGDGTLGLNFDFDKLDSVLDDVGNPADADFTGQVYTIDNTAPTLVSFTRYGGASNPTSNDTLYFLATFNEDVINVNTSDFSVNGSTATVTGVLQLTPSTYRLTVSGGDLAGYNGDVGVDLASGQDITDLATNPLPTGEPVTDETWAVDNAGSTVAIDQAGTQADPTNTSPINFTAMFSEAVTGFDGSDVALSGTAGATTANVTEIAPNDGTTYNVAVSGMTSDGTVIADVNANAAQDTGGNDSAASTSTDNQVTYDTTAPTVPGTTIEITYNLAGPTTFDITFSEDVYNPAGSTDPDDVTNPANYLLVEAGANGIFDTIDCFSGHTLDDVDIPINAVTYDNGSFTATVDFNFGTPLDNGDYRFFVCGSTSIVDLAGTPLNGGAEPGTDYIVYFVVAVPDVLPGTGFTPGVVTNLPAQPIDKHYNETNLMLEIPSLGIRRSIVGVPVVENMWDVTWLGVDIGYLSGTAFPTMEGNTVLTAHVYDNNNYPGPFANLYTLRYGDQIKIYAWGQVYTYEIRSTRVISAQYLGYAFQHETYDWITLITCEDYNPLTDSYDLRRVVRAVLVSVE